MIHWQKRSICVIYIQIQSRGTFFKIKCTRTKSLNSGVVVGGGGGEIRRSNDISFTSVNKFSFLKEGLPS